MFLKQVYSFKEKFYKTLFNKFKNDIRDTWKTINTLLNKINKIKNIS